MELQTPFGPLMIPAKSHKTRVAAVQRALDWCEKLVKGSLWNSSTIKKRVSLYRTINGQKVEIYPLEAARLDLGYGSTFPPAHLPINLNNNNACVRSSRNVRPRPLHTDMVASMILFLGNDNFDPIMVPHTLQKILTGEQRAALPARVYDNPFPREILERGQFTLTDAEAREYILDAEPRTWLHHAKRLTAERHPNTLCWILFEFIADADHPDSIFTFAVRWATEQLYANRDLYPSAQIKEALSHPSSIIRSWAVESVDVRSENNLLKLIKPMRDDVDPLVTHKVFTRIRQTGLHVDKKIDLISPLLDSIPHRSAAITHLGHLRLKPERKLEILAPFLESSNPNEVISSIRGLRDSGCQKTEQALIECFDHKDRSVLRALLQSVSFFGPWFEQYSLQLSTCPELHADLLRAMSRSHGFNQIPVIKDIMKNQRNTLIVRGIATLSKLHSIEGINLIGDYLMTHESRYVRRNAAEYLGESGRIAALAFLHRVGDDISIGVRNSARIAIEKINKKYVEG